MIDYVEKDHQGYGFYPPELLADKIYCTRDNRAALKKKGMNLLAKPLGRPSALQIHISPGERNPIEGKFGQAKTAYGLNRIRARLKGTSKLWLASIFLVLNLVKLTGVGFLYFFLTRITPFSPRLVRRASVLIREFSIGVILLPIYRFAEENFKQIIFGSQILKSNRLIPKMPA